LFLVFKVSLAVQYSQSKILLTIRSFKVFLNQHESGGAKSGLQEGCFDNFVLEALPNNFETFLTLTSKQSSLCVRFWISEPKGRTRFFQEVSSPPTTPELVLSVKVRLGNPPSGRSSKRDPISADAFETSRLLLRLFEMKLFEDLVCFENKRGFKGTGINERVR
jgi:hypothetical protein